MALKIVRTGRWLYDDGVERTVDIVALDYDWWHELAKADGTLEDGEVAEAPGMDGFLYYARFQRAGDDHEPTWVDSNGHKTCEEAMQSAEKKVVGRIIWKDDR